MASGLAAARAIVKSPSRALANYKDLLSSDFVLRDHRRLRHAPELIFSPFVQRTQPAIVCDVAEAMFTVTNPTPKHRLHRIVWRSMRRRNVRWREMARATWRAMRTFG